MTDARTTSSSRSCATVAGFLDALDAASAGPGRLPIADVGVGRVIAADDRAAALALAAEHGLRLGASVHAYHGVLVDEHGHVLTVTARVPAAHVALILAEVLLGSSRFAGWDNPSRLARLVSDRFEQAAFGASPSASSATGETLAVLLGDHLSDASYFPGDWALAPALRGLRASERVATACALAGTRPGDFAALPSEADGALSVPARRASASSGRAPRVR